MLTPDLEPHLRYLLEQKRQHHEGLADLLQLAGKQFTLLGEALAENEPTSSPAMNAASVSGQTLPTGSSPDADERAVGRLFAKAALRWLAATQAERSIDGLNVVYRERRNARSTVRSWLKLLEPAVQQANAIRQTQGLTVREVSTALAALDAGELPALFKPAKRKGRERNNHTLASLRLEIVALHAALRHTGMRKRDAERLACKAAAAASADTRRKWRAAGDKTLKKKEVRRIKTDVEAFVNHHGQAEIVAELAAVGSRYRKAFGLPA